MSTFRKLSLPRVSRTLDEIRSGLFARVEEVQDEYQAKGWLPARMNLNKGVIRGLLELVSWMFFQLYQLLEALLTQAVPLLSSGEWLDLHCDQVGATRKAATKAKGYVRFFRSPQTPESQNIPIPSGRIVRTLPDGNGAVYRYVTLADAVVQAGQAYAEVLAESEEYGAEANAGVGQIRELATPVSGIDKVSNTVDWLTDEAASGESDEQLRIRYMYAWLSRAGVTSASYQAAALSVKGCIEAAVSDQHPRGEGTIDVIVRGSAGIPTENLLEAVEAAINEQVVINHDLLVKSPVPVSIDAELELEIYSGDETALRLSAETFVRAMFSGDASRTGGHIPFGIGHDVVRERLAAGVITLMGVKRINWGGSLASGDVLVPADGLAILNSASVTAKWVSER
ncbi:baseplate J/gp47 family protein [uncultured Bilophila sp.]|uniref:baseplate J/gp47 family protein n=1 Tax=uncultured Bilophila sp. TaxID=529385 RepID=UPI00280AEAAD|nr:baseplate J/gp47 family protein [uncultured Bilophila sp.]